MKKYNDARGVMNATSENVLVRPICETFTISTWNQKIMVDLYISLTL